MDISAIIEACGGDGAVAARVGKARNTVAYWRHRGRIPAEVWTAIVALAAENETQITLEQLAAARASNTRSKAVLQ